MAKKDRKHKHYFKDVTHLTHIDVYRVLALYNVTDQALAHAAKKVLCSGGRGVKDERRDIQEAADTLNRRLEMYEEDELAAARGKIEKVLKKERKRVRKAQKAFTF